MECPQCESEVEPDISERCPECGADLILARIPNGLAVERMVPEVGGYRSDALPTSSATVTWRWWKVANGRHWAFALVLLCADLLFFLACRYFVVVMESWGPVFLTGFFVGLPLLMFHFTLVQRATTRTVLRADGAGVSVRWGPWWGGERAFDAASISQFFVRATRSDARLFVQTVDGGVQGLARHLTPSQARYLERLLEATLVVADRPVPGELPRDLRGAEGFRLVPWIQVIFLSVGVGLAGYLAWRPMERTRGVPVLPEPASFVVEASPAETMEFWTVTQVTASADLGLSTRLYYLAGFVHIEITLEDHAGNRTVLRCDPFETSYSDWQSRSQNLNTTEWSSVSRMDGCVARVESPGPVAIEARLVEGPDGSKLRFDRLELLVR